MSATGDTQRLDVGDLVLIPPATDHAVANDGDETLALVSVQSPAVSADELYSRRLAAQAAGYDDYDEDEWTRRAVIRRRGRRPRPRPGRLLPRHDAADGRRARASAAGSATARRHRRGGLRGRAEAVDAMVALRAARDRAARSSSGWRSSTRSPRD